MMNLIHALREGRNKEERKDLEKRLEKILDEIRKSRRSGKRKETASLFQEAARISHLLGDRKAIEYYAESAKASLSLKDRYNAGWSYRNAALMCFEFGDYEGSVNYSLKSLEMFRKENVRYGLQWCYNLIGESKEKLGRISSAVKYYTKSLDIAGDDEIEKRVRSLMKSVPNFSVRQWSDKASAREGEEVEFFISLRNPSASEIRNVRILDGNSSVLSELKALGPGEEKVFSAKIKKGEGSPVSPFRRIKWSTPDGGEFEKEFEEIRTESRPNIEMKAYFDQKPVLGKQSHFVIFVRNRSDSDISEVKLSMIFPVEIKVNPVSGYSIKRIGPGEEEGLVFKILPTVIGKTLLRPSITYMQGKESYEESMKPFFMEESLEIPGDKKIGSLFPSKVSPEAMKKVTSVQEAKREMSRKLEKKPLSEADYIRRKENLFSCSRGFSLKEVKLSEVISNIKEEMRDFYPVGEHKSGDHYLFLYSARSEEDKRLVLVTFLMKEVRGIVHVALKIYTNKEKGMKEFADRLTDVLRFTISTLNLATEVQKVEIKEIVNIIDSVIQRSSIGREDTEDKDKKIKIKDSLVQKTGF